MILRRILLKLKNIIRMVSNLLGMIKLLDIDGDHKITADNDRMILGQKRPKHIF